MLQASTCSYVSFLCKTPDSSCQARYALPNGNFQVDFYQQLQTQQETGRQCRIAWFDTSAASAASAAGYAAGYAATLEGSDAVGEVRPG